MFSTLFASSGRSRTISHHLKHRSVSSRCWTIAEENYYKVTGSLSDMIFERLGAIIEIIMATS